MNINKIAALVKVELKKVYRDPMILVVQLLMPVGLTLIFYLSMGNMGVFGEDTEITHFEYLVPGVMGYAVIYMGMMVALSLCDYRQDGLLKRLQASPASPDEYLGSLIIANMIIAVLQALIVLLLAWFLGYEVQGGLPGLLLVSVFLGVLAATAVGFGLLTATVAKDSGAASGLSMVFVLPMMMFGANLAVFDETTRTIARFTPNHYVTDSLNRIFNGASLGDPAIWQNLLILAVISLVVVTAGIQIFKRTEFR
jgi:ABC-type multidrug transport system permease subunit